MPEDSPERIKESYIRRLALTGRHAQEEFLMAELLSVLNPLLAVVGQEAKNRKCCGKPGKGFLQQIEHLVLLRRRLIARQIGLIEMDEVHGAQEGDDHEPEIQGHPGGHEEPAVEDAGEAKNGGVGHRGGLGCHNNKEGESEES